MEAKPGIYPNVPMAEYQAMNAVSRSILREFKRSPMHAHYAMTHPDEDTKALIFGEAVHCAVLEPERFKTRYATKPKVDGRTNKGKADLAAWEAEFPNAIGLTPDEMERCLGCYEAVWAHPLAVQLVSGAGKNEIVVVWQDEETGVMCKARPDRLTKWDGWTVVPDLKTEGRSAEAWEFSRAIATYGYHNQAAWYLDGFDAHAPLARRFLHIVVESDPPHGCAVYELAEAAIQQGREENRRWLRQYAACKEADRWPGYSTDLLPIDLPKWAQMTQEVFE